VTQTQRGRRPSLDHVRASLAERLRSRHEEIERAIFARVRAVSEPTAHEDAEYLAGLRATVAAIVDYSLLGIALGEAWVDPIPAIASTQARRAARAGVGLDTVLLRYAAGHRLLGDVVIAEAGKMHGDGLRHVLDEQGWLLERLIVAVSAEYKLAKQHAGLTSDQRHARCVERLLASEPVDASRLRYQLDASHLGVIATGVDAAEALRNIAARLECSLLLVDRREGTVWGWLGSQLSATAWGIKDALPAVEHLDVSYAVGEPGTHIEGFRKTHNQAQAARRVALCRPRKLTRYADTMLVSAALCDETLARSLTEIFLAPLASQRDGGAALRHTLRCYIDCDGNVSSTAAAMGIARHTVANRVRAAEQAMERAVHTCVAELDVALRLGESAPVSVDHTSS
jgi:hypothetical protein